MTFTPEQLSVLMELDRQAEPACGRVGCVRGVRVALRCRTCRASSLWCEAHAVEAVSGATLATFRIVMRGREPRLVCEGCGHQERVLMDLVEVVPL